MSVAKKHKTVFNNGNQWSARHDHRRFSRSLKRRSTWKHRPINDELLLTDNSSKLVNKIKRRISKKRTIFLRFSMLNGISADQLIWAKYLPVGFTLHQVGCRSHMVLLNILFIMVLKGTNKYSTWLFNFKSSFTQSTSELRANNFFCVKGISNCKKFDFLASSRR